MTAVATFSPASIAQVELHCTDLAAARRYYCDSLSLPLVGQVGDSIFVRCGEVNLIIQQTQKPKRGSTIYFNADRRIRNTGLQPVLVSFDCKTVWFPNIACTGRRPVLRNSAQNSTLDTVAASPDFYGCVQLHIGSKKP